MSTKRFYFLRFVGMPRNQYVYGLTSCGTVEEVEEWRSSRTRLSVEVYYLSEEFSNDRAHHIQKITDLNLISRWGGVRSEDRILFASDLPSTIRMVENIIETSKEIVPSRTRMVNEGSESEDSDPSYYESSDSQDEYPDYLYEAEDLPEDMKDFIVEDSEEMDEDGEYVPE